MKIQTRKWAILVLLFVVFGRDRSLSQSDELTIEQLSQKSSVIAIGRVTGLQSEWTADRTRIITRVSISVYQYLKGSDGSSVLTIAVPGGEIDGVGELYTHTPAFKRDEQVVVFAERDQNGRLHVVGGEQGKLRVTGDERSGRQLVSERKTLDEVRTIVKLSTKQQSQAK